jgi:hypothetical protein
VTGTDHRDLRRVFTAAMHKHGSDEKTRPSTGPPEFSHGRLTRGQLHKAAASAAWLATRERGDLADAWMCLAESLAALARERDG